MAKTLIGNIKGKDGRGISKVEKTATTGVVDTYTITYTDGTQSTYELKNSDDIAIQRQIVPSAAVESSDTASQAYAAGDYVVVNGILRKVKSAIAKGNTISDSNSTATTVAGELATIGDSVSQFLIGGRVAGMRFTCDEATDSKLTMLVNFVDGNWWAIDFTKDLIAIYDNATQTAKSVALA